MAMFNCGFGRRWSRNGVAFAGFNDEKNMTFISSNGYYGYLPVYGDDPNLMETDDINDRVESNRVGTFPNLTESPYSGNTMQHLSNYNRSNGRCIVQKITALPRKRNSSEEVDENHKRIKKEEPVTKDYSNKEIQLEHSLERSSVDLMETLLKQIHGCDMYNFYTTSDL